MLVKDTLVNQILTLLWYQLQITKGLMESIEKEPEETCIYKRLHLDYTYGLDNIYTREEIEKAKMSSLEREYCLKFAGI